MIILGLGAGSEVERTLNKYSNQKELLKRKLEEFIRFKLQNPYNGMVPGVSTGYGGSDRKFKPKGIFADALPDVSHAHLTHDLSVVYRIDSQANTFTIFGVYNHDSIGTGNPSNPNRQAQAGARWAGMDFNLGTGVDSDEMPDKIVADPERPGSFTATPSGKVDYTPKKKPQPTPAQKTREKLVDPFNAGVEIADSQWKQRNLKAAMANATGIHDKLRILNHEVQNLKKVKERGGQLYPNQMEYLRSLETLYNYLVHQQRTAQVREDDDEIGFFPEE